MKFVKNFISFVSVASLFWMMSCSSSLGDSTDISISFNVNALKNKTAKVMQNAGSISDGEGEFEVSDELYNAKLSVTLYEVKNAENIPSDYESFDKSLYKEISFSSCYADESGNMTVTLSAVPIGMKAIIVAEITAENENVQEVMFAGISKVFEVLPEKNIVDLELESCVIDEPVIQNFTLKFILSNQTENEITDIESGSSINIADKVKLDGYNVKFYEDANYSKQIYDTEIVINSDVTIYVELEAITYFIEYKLNDGIWADGFDYEKSYTIESAVDFRLPTSDKIIRQGYTFEGWYKDADYTEKITSLVGLFENITLYAKWEVILYNITYELAGGNWKDSYSENQKYTVEDASDTILPDSTWISKNGFVFEGWYDNAKYSGTAITNLAGKTGNITLYAKWRDENQVATVQFSEPAGGVDAGTNITLTCATENATIYYSYEGKEFNKDSWQNNAWHMYQSDAATSEGITIFANGSTNPVTIYAIAVCDGMENSAVATIEYTLNVYTLNFDAKGGTLPDGMQSSEQVTSGYTYKIPGDPTKTGYKFIGWYLSETPAETENSIQVYAPNIENTLNKTVTFYAKWEPIEYTVIFNPNGGSGAVTLPTQTFTYDVEQELYANPFTRTDYTFIGWNTVEDPTTTSGVSYNDKELVKNLTTSESITLYAQWEANKATITVTMPEYTDISELEEPIEDNNGSLTFTAPKSPEGVTYTHNIWYVNGKEKQQNMSSPTTWTFKTSEYVGGIYTIMLVVEDSNGNKYSAEWQVTVTK